MTAGMSRMMIASVPGQQPEPPVRYIPPGQGPNAFKVRPTPAFGQAVGPAPNTQPHPWIKRFIPPLALFNDASQWVNILSFNRPMPFNMAPDSNPVLRAQYFTPPPIDTIANLAAGQRNIQQQLGNVAIQAARLDVQASNYFGGSN